MENENLNLVTIKKVDAKQWESAQIVLKASGKFDEKTLKAIEVSRIYNGKVELNDSQAEILKGLNLVDRLEEIENTRINEGVEEKNTKGTENEFTPQNGDEVKKAGEDEKPTDDKDKKEQEENESQDDELEEKDKSDKELKEDNEEKNDLEEEKKENEENDELEDENRSEIENKKDEESEKQEDELEEFAPEQNEQEVKGKHYYLTPERMLESIKRMNGGRTWEMLGKVGANNINLQYAIEKAYKSCIYPGDLRNPDFLDNAIKRELPENNQLTQLRGMHMSALLGTYVGYHVEKNEGDVDNLGANGEEKNTTAIIKFPLLASELPKELKEEFDKDLTKQITTKIEEIMNSNNSYKALMILTPIEKTIDRALGEYSDELQTTEKNKTQKAYIMLARSDIKDKLKTNFQSMNVQLDFYDIDWDNKDTRKDVIAMIDVLQQEGRETEIPKLIEEINVSFRIDSSNDLQRAESLCADLSKISKQNVQVNIAFDMPPEQAMNPEVQRELDTMVDKYDNMDRNKPKENMMTLENAITDGFERAEKMVIAMVAAGQILDQEKAAEEISTATGVGGDIVKNIIMRLAAGAHEVPKEIETPGDELDDPARLIVPTEGSDA